METSYKVLGTYVYSFRAYTIKSLLEKNGIEVLLHYEDGEANAGAMEKGVCLKVKEQDFAKASRLLEEFSKESNINPLEHEPEIRRILVPVDFSDQTQHICEYALDLAERFNAEILIMHACYIPSLDAALLSESSVYSVTLDEHLHNLESSAQSNLDQLIKQLKERNRNSEQKELNIKPLLVKGFADDEIYIVYQEYQPDLIVMGNSSRGVKSHKLYGSVTQEIIENVLVPVIVAPSKPVTTNLKEIRNILYITNFDNSDIRAIHKLIYLVSPFHLKLHVVHLGGNGSGGWNEIKLEGLKEHLRKEFMGFNFHTEIISDPNQLEKLENYIQEHKIDILSMVTHKRNFLSRLFKSNLTEKILFNSTRPMLIFH